MLDANLLDGDPGTLAWVREGPRPQLPLAIAQAVGEYAESAYADIWRFYDLEKNYACLTPECVAFDELWTHKQCSSWLVPHHGLVLFEGQGLYECDMLTANVGDVFVRKRPTSSSWSLDAALRFADPDSGVLLVHSVMPTVRAFVMGDLAAKPEEHEVLLQPGVKLTVVRLSDHLGVRSLYTECEMYSEGHTGSQD